MPQGWSDSMNLAVAESLREVLDMLDPESFIDGQIPVCEVSWIHKWIVVHDKSFDWNDGYAKGTTTYRVALECEYCKSIVGVG